MDFGKIEWILVLAAFAQVVFLLRIRIFSSPPPRTGFEYWTCGYWWDRGRSVWFKILLSLLGMVGWFLFLLIVRFFFHRYTG